MSHPGNGDNMYNWLSFIIWMDPFHKIEPCLTLFWGAHLVVDLVCFWKNITQLRKDLMSYIDLFNGVYCKIMKNYSNFHNNILLCVLRKK